MSSKSSVTIRDVARKVGVSPGTVSRAINDSPLVSAETRRRVMEVVRELNYTPNLVARRLSLGKTLTVAAILPFLTRPTFAERLNGILSVLSRSRYDLLVHTVETIERRGTGFQNILRRDRVDGALIVSLPIPDEDVEQIVSSDVPIVLIDTSHRELFGYSSVTVDDVAGGRVATEYLIRLGHRNIGFVGDVVNNPFGFVSSWHRYVGYCKALRNAGIPLHPDHYAENQHGRQEARQISKRILSLRDRPTAIFAASDTQATGVLEAARELGLRVPEDLSVIGYDDIELADIMRLTTIRQLLFESGQRGVELLFRTLENPQAAPVHDVLPTELIVRDTTAPPL